MEFHSSVLTSVSGLIDVPTSTVGAALFTRMDIDPKRSATASVTERTLSSWLTSNSKNSASLPAPRMRSTTFCPRSLVRPVTATAAPSAANCCAIDRPMPRVDPEMSATFPSSRMGPSLSAKPSRRVLRGPGRLDAVHPLGRDDLGECTPIGRSGPPAVGQGRGVGRQTGHAAGGVAGGIGHRVDGPLVEQQPLLRQTGQPLRQLHQPRLDLVIGLDGH